MCAKNGIDITRCGEHRFGSKPKDDIIVKAFSAKQYSTFIAAFRTYEPPTLFSPLLS